MAEYIERETALKNIKETIIGASEFANDIRIATMNAVESVPTADVQEVRHGKWLPTNHPEQKRCSVCDVISFIASYPCIYRADYCPHCSAKME